MKRVLKPALRDATICDRHNRYCGPRALSCMFGVSTGQAAEALRIAGGRSSIRGAYNYEMVDAIRRFNGVAYRFRAYQVDDEDYSLQSYRKTATLSRLMSKRKELRKELLLVNTTGHYIVMQGNRFADTHTFGKVVSTSKAPHRRAKIVCFWVIRHKDDPPLRRDIHAGNDYGMKQDGIAIRP